MGCSVSMRFLYLITYNHHVIYHHNFVSADLGGQDTADFPLQVPRHRQTPPCAAAAHWMWIRSPATPVRAPVPEIPHVCKTARIYTGLYMQSFMLIDFSDHFCWFAVMIDDDLQSFIEQLSLDHWKMHIWEMVKIFDLPWFAHELKLGICVWIGQMKWLQHSATICDAMKMRDPLWPGPGVPKSCSQWIPIATFCGDVWHMEMQSVRPEFHRNWIYPLLIYRCVSPYTNLDL